MLVGGVGAAVGAEAVDVPIGSASEGLSDATADAGSNVLAGVVGVKPDITGVSVRPVPEAAVGDVLCDIIDVGAELGATIGVLVMSSAG